MVHLHSKDYSSTLPVCCKQNTDMHVKYNLGKHTKIYESFKKKHLTF